MIFQILNLLALLAFCCHFHQKYVCLRKRLKYLYLSKKRNTFASEKNWNTFISEKDYLIIMSHWGKIIKPQFALFCLISPHNRLISPHNRLISPHNRLISPHFASNRLRCCLNLPQNDSESPPRNNVSDYENVPFSDTFPSQPPKTGSPWGNYFAVQRT